MNDYFAYELVSTAKPLDNGRLDIVFRNGRRGVFDCTPYFSDKYWSRLAEPAFFNLVSVDHGTLTWPGDVDIAPEEVWRDSISVTTKGKP